MGHMISVVLKGVFSKFSLVQFTAEGNTNDLTTLASLIHAGTVKVHIEKIYSYKEIPKAILKLCIPEEKWL